MRGRARVLPSPSSAAFSSSVPARRPPALSEWVQLLCVVMAVLQTGAHEGQCARGTVAIFSGKNSVCPSAQDSSSSFAS
jgi:hypothetical protein